MSSTEIVVQAPSLDPIEELRGSLKNLYQNPEFSDLTIESRHAEYRVHKAVVCPRSDYFAAKCREPSSKVDLKVAIEGTLSLAEDDPQAVGMVIRNGQTSSCHDDDFNGSIKSDDQVLEKDIKPGDHSEPLDDFLPPQPQRLSKKQKKRAKANAKLESGIAGSPDHNGETLSSPITQDPSVLNQAQENHSEGGGAVLHAKPIPVHPVVNGIDSGCGDDSLVLHANVYLLSKKYGISGLRALAFDKFRAEAESQWNTEEFLHAAEKVYTSCSDSNEDREMKDIIVGIICRHGELMDKVEMQKVMRTLPRDLMYDILLQVRQQGGFASCEEGHVAEERS
ncbi:hypothetical protein CSUB01_09568 [Colletotrichum sublineola]|uniref:BTB domain-containing protein n=1 Tax=Colletotrichum sublineola TaxID=1173701 RepID=A0A066XGZ5_COLSU|nr:hypothetical protein CSUB01_09568 [Colletotrichum sublineola]